MAQNVSVTAFYEPRKDGAAPRVPVEDYNKRLGYGTDQGRFLQQQVQTSAASGAENPFRAYSSRRSSAPATGSHQLQPPAPVASNSWTTSNGADYSQSHAAHPQAPTSYGVVGADYPHHPTADAQALAQPQGSQFGYAMASTAAVVPGASSCTSPGPGCVASPYLTPHSAAVKSPLAATQPHGCAHSTPYAYPPQPQLHPQPQVQQIQWQSQPQPQSQPHIQLHPEPQHQLQPSPTPPAPTRTSSSPTCGNFNPGAIRGGFNPGALGVRASPSALSSAGCKGSSCSPLPATLPAAGPPAGTSLPAQLPMGSTSPTPAVTNAPPYLASRSQSTVTSPPPYLANRSQSVPLTPGIAAPLAAFASPLSVAAPTSLPSPISKPLSPQPIAMAAAVPHAAPLYTPSHLPATSPVHTPTVLTASASLPTAAYAPAAVPYAAVQLQSPQLQSQHSNGVTAFYEPRKDGAVPKAPVEDYNQRLGYGTDQGRFLQQQMQQCSLQSNPYRAKR